MRSVIYARYSSDHQREASIEDQIRICRQYIEKQGWQYLHAYSDRAISGASALRPGYQNLLEDARATVSRAMCHSKIWGSLIGSYDFQSRCQQNRLRLEALAAG